MKFKSVSFKNFYRWGPEEQTLDLSGKGVWNISAPNGYGKSSIIEAIVYTLYGKTKQDSVDDVVNRYTGKDCKTSVEFEEDGKTYKVVRYRKHSTHNNNVYLFEGDKDISAKGTPETNQKILDIIKMPYIAFINSTIFSSALYNAFLGSSESDRLKIFENILSLKEINIFYLETKEMIKELNEKASKVILLQNTKDTEITTLTKSMDDYKAKAKASLLSLKAQREEDERVIEDCEKKIKEYSSIDIDKERAKIGNLSLLEQYKKDIVQLESGRIVDEGDSGSASEKIFVETYKDVDFTKAISDEEAYKKDKLEHDASKEALSLIEKDWAAVIRSLEKAQADSAKADGDEKRLLKELDDIKLCRCPRCGQAIDWEKVEAEKKGILSEIEACKSLKEESEKKIADATENREKYEADKKNLNDKMSAFDSKWKGVRIYENSVMLKEQYDSYVKLLSSYEDKRASDKAHNDDIDARVREVEGKIKSLSLPEYTAEFIDGIDRKVKELQDGIAKCRSEMDTINGSAASVYDKSYIEGLEKDIAEKSGESKKIAAKLLEINEDIKYYTYLSECFSNKSGGFKKYFIGEMIDVFNGKVNQYLPFFFNEDTKITFDRDLKETIEMDGFEVSFSSFSNGQKGRAELAIAFALFNLSRIFFSNDNSLLVVDEMLDNGLDEYGIKSAISVLNAFADDAKIFIVSHNPLIKENIDKVIEIKRDENGFSVLKE